MPKTVAIILLLSLVFAACVQQPAGKTVNATLGEEFRLGTGETAFIQPDNLKITFLNVTEGSRCPSDVVCVWAGQAVAVLQISKEDRVFFPLANITVSGSGEGLSNANVDGKGYSLKITKLEPYPKSTEKTANYTVTLVVSKAPEKIDFNSSKIVSCTADADCQLVNSELEFACCYAGACQRINYSEGKWIAVNAEWFNSAREANCPSKGECGPSPMCPTWMPVDDIEAKCIASKCEKVPKPNYTLEWSDGACAKTSDCSAIEYGCGGGHIECTNNTAKWKGVISTCEIVENHPSKQGYSCTCISAENKCGWKQ
jgi:hypothetical protein